MVTKYLSRWQESSISALASSASQSLFWVHYLKGVWLNFLSHSLFRCTFSFHLIVMTRLSLDIGIRSTYEAITPRINMTTSVLLLISATLFNYFHYAYAYVCCVQFFNYASDKSSITGQLFWWFRFITVSALLCWILWFDVFCQIEECRNLDERKSFIIPCLIDHVENVTNSQCKEFLHKMEAIVFSDYRLVYRFVESCEDDILRLKCGRLTDDDDAKVSY